MQDLEQHLDKDTAETKWYCDHVLNSSGKEKTSHRAFIFYSYNEQHLRCLSSVFSMHAPFVGHDFWGCQVDSRADPLLAHVCSFTFWKGCACRVVLPKLVI